MSTRNPENKLDVQDKRAIDETQGETTWEGLMFQPDVDIYSTDDRMVLLTDLPGVKRENLDIDLREGVLTIVGRTEDVPKGYQPLREEYQVGGYTRRFTLSDDIDADGIQATLKDGILELVLPRAEKAMPRKIAVQAG